MIRCDLLVVTVPYTDTDYPLQAPAIIKASVEKHGYVAHTLDLNNDFLKQKQTENFDLLKNYFSFRTINDKSKISIIEKYIKETAQKLLYKYNPTWIAMSVFTYQCQVFSEMLAREIKSVDPSIKIIFGGQGISTVGIHVSEDWVKRLQKEKVIDHYIISEGEVSIIALLQKGHGPGIDNKNWQQQLDLERAPLPNYSDYNLNDYSSGRLMITGSRGCVRKCSFCDIHKHWKKFVFRSGGSISDEMIEQSKTYKKYKFQFTDSLINGSMKAYRDFIKKMANYNSTTENKLSWGGQFIVRGLGSMTRNDWNLTKLAGAESLSIGVESGSESVRNHMKKQFSDRDLDEFVEQAFINEIQLTFLMIIGYPTETESDFQHTLDMFDRYRKYKKIIKPIQLGSTLGVLPGTPLAEEHGADLELNNGENFWIYNHNKNLDFKERIRRRIFAGEELIKMGYEIVDNESQIKLLHFLWNVYKKKQKQGLIDLNTSEVSGQKYS